MTSAAASAFRAACKASDTASVDVQETLCEGGCALFCGFWERPDDGGATGREIART